ncbi:cadherin domain-containing protein [Aeromonas media]|uniref:cadherin domain-containing protein n=3 Tax=Aeromonas media TaxID=651 RepID=UPI00384E7A4B
MADISGTNKNDSLIGGTGADLIDGGNGSDMLDGGSGSDTLLGGNGEDTLYGGLGDDILSGGNGQDLVYGGSGNDVIGTSLVNSENGNDIIYGDGWDDYRQQSRAIAGSDTIYGGNGSETIYGDNGDGHASGGNDSIYAGNGNDTVYGEGGDDTIQGGNGADLLSGGSGNDLFVYQSAMESNSGGMDTIRDFSGVRDANPDNDKVDLRPLLGSTDLKWGGTTSLINGVWYEQNAGQNATYIKADTNGDGQADLVIKLDGLKDLSNTDFLGVQNNGPTITSDGGGSSAALAIDENTTVVTTVTASDPDVGALLTYTIVGGADAGLFTINPNTGALSFVNAPNRESPSDSNGDNTYEVVVRVSDGSAFDEQTFTIAINDVDEFDVTTPTDTNAATDAVDENIAIGSLVGITAFASDADATTNAVTYSLSGNPGGLFAIDPATGVVTVATAIDREALGASVNIEVTATSADGSSQAQTFTIAINDVDEFDVTTPTDTNAATDAVDENIAIGSLVGITAFASDADATTNAVTYSLSGNPGGLFAIDPATGVVTVATAIDREALGASVNIEVTATSADGSSQAQTFTIAINDVDEFDVTTPTDTNAATNAVDENIAIGSLVGITAFASDADATTNAVTYSLSGNPGGLFAIDPATGVVTVATAIDREALGASVNIEVTATSADGSSQAQTFTIAINDVDEFDVTTPTDTNAATNAVDENIAIGSLVGITAFASDADATTNAVTYSLSGNPGGLFAIDPATGVVTVAAAIDREALGASVNIEVTATSADGSSQAQTFTIAINDVDEFDVTTPTDTNAATDAVDENIAIGSLVGITAFASDADATTNAVTYSLSGNPGGLFAIDPATGVVTVATAIDREALGASVNIEVTATSADGSSQAQTFTIAINDVDEFDVTTPTDTNAATNAVDENIAIGSLVGITAFASDADATTNAVTYSLSGNPGGLFAIDPATGVVTVATAIDREALGASVNIEVTATSADGSSQAQTFTIAVNNLDEIAPTITSGGTAAAINENSGAGQVVYTATADDSADISAGVTFSLAGTDANKFTINAITGAVTLLGNPDHETQSSYSFSVLASDGVNPATEQAVTLAVNNLDEVAPTVLSITGISSRSGNSGTATFTVTFSEQVNGVSAEDFTLFGSATSVSPFPSITGVSGSGSTWTVTVAYDGRQPANGDRGNTLGLNLNAGNNVIDSNGNVATSTSFGTPQIASLAPAGIAGEPIHLALEAPEGLIGLISMKISGVPSGWTINDGNDNGDGTWSLMTEDPSGLTVTTPADFVGAAVLAVNMSWTNVDGSMGSAYIADNVEAYAPGSPIFALSQDDNLTGSSGADQFVFAQPIGNNVVYNFDVTTDRLDLIGFAGVTSMANVQIGNDADGNAVISIGEGQSITIKGVDGALLGEANFEFNVDPVTRNGGTLTIDDGAIMPFGGSLINEGMIALGGHDSGASLEILFRGASLSGGGQLVLSDSDHNALFGGSADTVLFNIDNSIRGAGQLGAGQLILNNAGSIIADGSHALVIDTGDEVIINSGMLAAIGAGGLIIDSGLDNSGLLCANGGNVTLNAAVSGTGSALISGMATLAYAAASNMDTAFALEGDGILRLAHAADFTGTVSGFNAGDKFELADVGNATISYVSNATASGGVLTIDDGTHRSEIQLQGTYTTAGFQMTQGEDASTTISYHAILADQILTGTESDDGLVGSDGNDTLNGLVGHDVLVGGEGSDTFVFGREGGVDTITDFNGANLIQGGDVLDLRDLFQDTTGGDLSDYLAVREENGSTILSVDRDGATGDAGFQDLVLLQGTTGLHLDELQQQGNLLTHG